jgi:hypothetical protein
MGKTPLPEKIVNITSNEAGTLTGTNGEHHTGFNIVLSPSGVSDDGALGQEMADGLMKLVHIADEQTVRPGKKRLLIVLL